MPYYEFKCKAPEFVPIILNKLTLARFIIVCVLPQGIVVKHKDNTFPTSVLEVTFNDKPILEGVFLYEYDPEDKYDPVATYDKEHQ